MSAGCTPVAGVGLQVLQQLAGINTVMYYTPAILELAGIHDNRLALLVRPSIAPFSAAGVHEATSASACILLMHAPAASMGARSGSALQVALAPAGVNAAGTVAGMLLVDRCGRR